MTLRKAVVVPARLVGVVRAAVAQPPPVEPAEPEPAPPELPSAPALNPVEEERLQLRRLLAQLAAQVEQLTLAPTSLQELQHAAVELGTAIAARLVFHQIAAGAFGIEQLVRGALERLPARHPAIVRLHPEDLALLQQRLGGDDALHAEQDVQLRPDPGLARGDCRVQAGDLGVGSSLRARLAEARDRILEGIPSEARP